MYFLNGHFGVGDFSKRLGVENARTDAHNEINSDVVFSLQLVVVFGTRHVMTRSLR